MDGGPVLRLKELNPSAGCDDVHSAMSIFGGMSLFGTSLSGLKAAQISLNVTANNIANLNTPGFKADRVDLASAPDEDGVEVAGVQSTDLPVDPTTEMQKLIQDRLLYGANAMVVRAADQMYGSLLNVLDTDNQQQNQNS
jgi:flagellar hook-associated protein FlgK